VVTEKALRFGRESHLVGVLTMPDNISTTAHTAVILLNAGLINHLGPHRVHVRLARHLAELGIPCLRFDFSGIGESANATQLDTASQVSDVADAIDRLVADSVATNFVLFGICAGAVHGYQAAVVNERVSGIVLCDGYLYPTWKTKPLFYLKKITNKASIAAFARRTFRSLVGGKNPGGPAGPVLDYSTGTIPADSYAKGLATLERRGAWVAQVITGSYPYLYCYQDQFDERFRSYRFGERITTDYLPDADHTFMTRALQNQVIELVGRKMQAASHLQAANAPRSTPAPPPSI
jgi:pimeloyl-ACP methyl ester carboxylesterase